MTLLTMYFFSGLLFPLTDVFRSTSLRTFPTRFLSQKNTKFLPLCTPTGFNFLVFFQGGVFTYEVKDTKPFQNSTFSTPCIAIHLLQFEPTNAHNFINPLNTELNPICQ